MSVSVAENPSTWGEYTRTEEDIQYNYIPFDISGCTSYHPASSIFDDIVFPHGFRTIDTVFDKSTQEIKQKEMHIKFSPLLDPVKYIIGKYNLSDPTIKQIATFSEPNPSYTKLGSIHNAAFVDSFFYYLSATMSHKYNFVNAIDSYGFFAGIQSKYKMNLEVDFDFIHDSPFFLTNVSVGDIDASNNKLFILPENEVVNKYMAGIKQNNSSQSNYRKHIQIEDTDCGDDIQIDIDVIEDNNIIQEPCDQASTLNDMEECTILLDDINEPDSMSQSSSNASSTTSVTEEEEEEDGDCDDSSYTTIMSDESSVLSIGENAFMYIRDFPVQMIFMEKLSGTLDELLVRKELSDDQASSALMQVIMTLIAYRKAYDFTHNDLHTSNIMYKKTDVEYLYYRYNGVSYRVPTFGRIFTIIDFGRAIYKYRGQLFCSDSFSSDGDAATQYNTEPFFDETKNRIDPNPSFDLCRLACSMYDLVLEHEYDIRKLSEYQRTIFRWCQDDSGRNVLYKRNGDERYPDFKLYKMIARTVHEHIPEAQLKYPFFSKWESTDTEMSVIDLDRI
jgi:hypothetical protein